MIIHDLRFRSVSQIPTGTEHKLTVFDYSHQKDGKTEHREYLLDHYHDDGFTGITLVAANRSYLFGGFRARLSEGPPPAFCPRPLNDQMTLVRAIGKRCSRIFTLAYSPTSQLPTAIRVALTEIDKRTQ